MIHVGKCCEKFDLAIFGEKFERIDGTCTIKTTGQTGAICPDLTRDRETNL